MDSKLFFEIPDDQEVIVRLVEAIPIFTNSIWQWRHTQYLHGRLEAPRDLLDSGKAETNTGFALHGCYKFLAVTGRSNTKLYSGCGIEKDEWERRLKEGVPNPFAIVVEQKLPGFIFFEGVGLEREEPNPVITFEFAKRVAIHFLRKGYRGSFGLVISVSDTFSTSTEGEISDGVSDEIYHTCVVYKMVFSLFEGIGDEIGRQPARVRLEWEKSEEKIVAPIVALCRSLNLREYIPGHTKETTIG